MRPRLLWLLLAACLVAGGCRGPCPCESTTGCTPGETGRGPRLLPPVPAPPPPVPSAPQPPQRVVIEVVQRPTATAEPPCGGTPQQFPRPAGVPYGAGIMAMPAAYPQYTIAPLTGSVAGLPLAQAGSGPALAAGPRLGLRFTLGLDWLHRAPDPPATIILQPAAAQFQALSYAQPAAQYVQALSYAQPAFPPWVAMAQQSAAAGIVTACPPCPPCPSSTMPRVSEIDEVTRTLRDIRTLLDKRPAN